MKKLVIIIIILVSSEIFALEEKINNIKSSTTSPYIELKIEDYTNIREKEIEYNINKVKLKGMTKDEEELVSFLLNDYKKKSNPILNSGFVFTVYKNNQKINVLNFSNLHKKNDCSLFLMLNDLRFCGMLENKTLNIIQNKFEEIYNIKINNKLLNDYYLLHEYSHLLEQEDIKSHYFTKEQRYEAHSDLVAIELLKELGYTDFFNIYFKRAFEDAMQYKIKHLSHTLIKEYLNKEYLKGTSLNEKSKEIKKIIKEHNPNFKNNLISEEIYYKNIEMINFLKKLSLNPNIKRKDRNIISNIFLSFNLKNYTLKRKLKQ